MATLASLHVQFGKREIYCEPKQQLRLPIDWLSHGMHIRRASRNLKMHYVLFIAFVFHLLHCVFRTWQFSKLQPMWVPPRGWRAPIPWNPKRRFLRYLLLTWTTSELSRSCHWCFRTRYRPECSLPGSPCLWRRWRRHDPTTQFVPFHPLKKDTSTNMCNMLSWPRNEMECTTIIALKLSRLSREWIIEFHKLWHSMRAAFFSTDCEAGARRGTTIGSVIWKGRNGANNKHWVQRDVA